MTHKRPTGPGSRVRALGLGRWSQTGKHVTCNMQHATPQKNSELLIFTRGGSFITAASRRCVGLRIHSYCINQSPGGLVPGFLGFSFPQLYRVNLLYCYRVNLRCSTRSHCLAILRAATSTTPLALLTRLLGNMSIFHKSLKSAFLFPATGLVSPFLGMRQPGR